MPGDGGYQHDLLVIGGGGAGLPAAIAAAGESNRLSIAGLSKGDPMRSHTLSAEGGTAAVMRENDSLDTHAKDTIFRGDFLAHQDGGAGWRRSTSTTARCAPSRPRP